MVDGFSEESVVVVAVHSLKQEYGQQFTVKIDMSDIVFMYDDVHIMDRDVDVGVFVIESGESDFVDTLFKRGNPNHRRGAVTLAIGASVV